MGSSPAPLPSNDSTAIDQRVSWFLLEGSQNSNLTGVERCNGICTTGYWSCRQWKGCSILCLIGVEVVDSDLAQLSIDKVTEVDKSFLHENGKLDKDPVYNNPIEVDSHSEEPDKEEENGAFDPHFPKDVVNEWPTPKQIHSFHFIRYRFYEDPAIKAKLDQADKEIRKWNKARFKLTDELKAKRDSSILELAVPHLQAKKLAAQYQKEADKCNSGMDTCEEAREKAEEALSAQMKLTAIWEIIARQKGWREKVAKSNAFPYFI
ncbi:hypothetical protein ES332_A10G108100v1 [Gossypium tomentosum]|uniref:Uncharacterized protein n=1 Tax=Gossypium tomentosum TaxID=34277 RepID=A0A5D2NNI5_GOSTO|nr:hypothetical protein ES332_A10G108100v1 [Gossypium tomentosum]